MYRACGGGNGVFPHSRLKLAAVLAEQACGEEQKQAQRARSFHRFCGEQKSNMSKAGSKGCFSTPTPFQPSCPRGYCGRKIPPAVLSPPSSLNLLPGVLRAVVAFTQAGVGYWGCQQPLSPPKTSLSAAEGFIPLLGGKAGAVGQEHGVHSRPGEEPAAGWPSTTHRHQLCTLQVPVCCPTTAPHSCCPRTMWKHSHAAEGKGLCSPPRVAPILLDISSLAC